MARLVLTRLAAAVPTLFVVVALSFFLMRLAPGGPFDQERALDPSIKASLEHLYGLDKPLPTQFWLYLRALAHGDLGPSTHWRDFTVNDLFAKALPISVRLGAEALGLALVVGVLLGVVGDRSQWLGAGRHRALRDPLPRRAAVRDRAAASGLARPRPSLCYLSAAGAAARCRTRSCRC